MFINLIIQPINESVHKLCSKTHYRAYTRTIELYCDHADNGLFETDVMGSVVSQSVRIYRFGEQLIVRIAQCTLVSLKLPEFLL